MKQTLLITTLLAAGVTNAFATADHAVWGGGNVSNLNKNSTNEWTYHSVQESYYAAHYDDLGWYGSSFAKDGELKTNKNWRNTHLVHHKQNTTIELNKDARYEVNFEFKLTQGGSTGDQAMAGMYLAGSKGSIFFGNAQLNRNDDRRDAVLVKYGADISKGNDDDYTQIYFPNGEFLDSNKMSAPFYYNAPHATQRYTVVSQSDNAFESGVYNLKIVIESFADKDKQDMLYLYARTPDGEKWLTVQGLDGLGFTTDAYFDAYGFVLHNDGASTATAQKMAGYEYARSLKPTEIVPDIPEPSAFGLLAGAGALALVAARRRRSRL